MDSLLASYASSDDDGEAEISRPPKLSSLSNSGIYPKPSSLSASGTPRSASLFSRSLPPPRTSVSSSSSSSSSSSPSSFLFSSLPPPKSLLPNHSLNDNNEHDEEKKPLIQPSSPHIFSSLPPPKASSFSTSSTLPAPKLQSGNQSNKLSLDKNRNKKIVHFTLPLNPSVLRSQDSDNDDDGEEEKRRKATKDAAPFSFPKALSSMLPAPKNSLCIAPAQSSGASRRSSFQAESSSPKGAQESKEEQGVGSFGADRDAAAGFYDTYGSYTVEQGASDYVNCTNHEGNWTSKVMDHEAVGLVDSTYAINPSLSQWEHVDGNGVGFESYMDNSSIVSQVAKQSEALDMRIITGKRGRKDIPTVIVEVKQDELMKNRPREDQSKLTGIAFGPAYQPAPSAKGKPTKLHKRKHQIGSLYYDLKQKEMELTERRSKGLLTKAETQAKYGW